MDLAELVLRNNNFEFDGKHYLQTLGMAIGTKMAPAYANIFMDRLEQRLLSEAEIKLYLWFRYIDDIFMVWLGSESDLRDFLNYINAAHETIKFTWNWSREGVNYLDVRKSSIIEARLIQIYTQSQRISINIYSPPPVIQEDANRASHMPKH